MGFVLFEGVCFGFGMCVLCILGCVCNVYECMGVCKCSIMGVLMYGVFCFLGGGVAHILLDICPRVLRYSQIAELGLNLSGS